MDITKMLGAIPSEYDPRDYSVKMVRMTFPETFELPDVEIYYQGAIGNCVMQALRSAPHSHYKQEFGATFGYGRWRSHAGQGMRPNEACNGFVTEGIPPLTDDNKWLEMPEAQEYANSNATRLLKAAEPYKGWTWARLNTVDEIKATIMQGVRCIACLPYVGIVNNRWLVDGEVAGYHEMALIGWTKDGFKVRNSWGKAHDGSLGSKGDGYVTVAFSDVFACNDVIGLFPPKQEDKPIIEPRRTLRLKTPYMKGEDVALLQRRLTVHGFTVTQDGIFGAKTEAAVKAFQRASALTVDGIVGRKTWVALEMEPTNKTRRFVAWLNKQLGHIYVWSAQGQEVDEAFIRRHETSTNNANRAITLYRKRKSEGMNPILAYDCSGLGMKWLLDNKVLPKDLTAAGMYSVCQKIKREELRSGDFVFIYGLSGIRLKVHHVGYVVEDGNVIEAMGRDVGVVKHPLDGRWNRYGRLDALR